MIKSGPLDRITIKSNSSRNGQKPQPAQVCRQVAGIAAAAAAARLSSRGFLDPHGSKCVREGPMVCWSQQCLLHTNTSDSHRSDTTLARTLSQSNQSRPPAMQGTYTSQHAPVTNAHHIIKQCAHSTFLCRCNGRCCCVMLVLQHGDSMS